MKAFQELDQRLKVQLDLLSALMKKDVAEFNRLARRLALPIIASAGAPDVDRR